MDPETKWILVKDALDRCIRICRGVEAEMEYDPFDSEGNGSAAAALVRRRIEDFLNDIKAMYETAIREQKENGK